MVMGPWGNEMGSRVFQNTDWWRPVPEGVRLFDDGGHGPDAPHVPADREPCWHHEGPPIAFNYRMRDSIYTQ